MSTRRARIKAVTSLPPRRKNAESTDAKNKQIQVKDEQAEKNPKSPRTSVHRQLEKKIEERLLPPTKSIDRLNTNEGNTHVKTPKKNDKIINTTRVDSPTITADKTAHKYLDKVSGGAIMKPNKSIFVSPQLRRDSPAKKTFASPLAPSPKNTTKSAEFSQAKSVTPQRKPPNEQTINENNELQITDRNINKITHNKGNTPSTVTQGQNVLSVPVESITNEMVMDGIVPLHQAGSVAKPIDLLKNEIISENAEVLFDPIVPLPSPSKVRAKLRPQPRLGPHRRSSIQGSASESEDESRRAQISSGTATPSMARQRHDSHTSISTQPSLPHREVTRVRNDSICSIGSQMAQPASTVSPLKEKHNSRSRRQEAANRRAAAMRRKRDQSKRESLTMYDLIFYNPTSNPIVPDEDEIKAKQEDAKDAKDEIKKLATEEAKNATEPESLPAPQIKLGPNGEIVLDEKSLVIKPTDDGRNITSVVREGAWAPGGGKYRRCQRTADWSAAETVRFYRALAAIGTDFTLMAQLFPDRNRRDLKIKFKKEEKQNCALVDKALRSATTWDAEQLQGEFNQERAEAKRRAQLERERLAKEKEVERERLRVAREARVRNSKGCKALESTMIPGVTVLKDDELTTANDIVENLIQTRTTKKIAHMKANSSQYATLTLINKNNPSTTTTYEADSEGNPDTELIQMNSNSEPTVVKNIESGSLVVLTVNDPKSPSKKMLQTYIAHENGNLTPVALPATLLNSVVGYMKKSTPKSATAGSPHLTSPMSIASHDSRSSAASTSQNNPSPAKRKRHNSFTITPL